ncbi:hypothetical protein niasHS_014984 [Heterodera schachtii]|uniref:Transmembrane protein n=1 Tax=Heterodera schachtii TaxID=97005 RepID=A0ABD2I265_HETSC
MTAVTVTFYDHISAADVAFLFPFKSRVALRLPIFRAILSLPMPSSSSSSSSAASFSSVFPVPFPASHPWNPFASAAPFVIAIGGGSVCVKNGECRQYNQLKRHHHESAPVAAEMPSVDEGMNATDKRRKKRGPSALATLSALLLLGVALIVSLAFVAWTIHRMNEQHKECAEAMKTQAERIEVLENAVTKQKQTEEKETEEPNDNGKKSHDKKRRDNKTSAEQQIVTTQSDNWETNDRRQFSQRKQPKELTGNGGRDFVIFMKGRPISGRHFLAKAK